MADEYTFDFAVVAADDAASIDAGGKEGLIDLPKTHFILNANTQDITRIISAVDANLKSVPLVHLSVAQRDRLMLVHERFTNVLAHTPTLRVWLSGAVAPYQSVIKMVVAIGGNAAMVDVPAILKLEVALESGSYDHICGRTRATQTRTSSTW